MGFKGSNVSEPFHRLIFKPLFKPMSKVPKLTSIQSILKVLTGLLLMTETCCLFRHFTVDGVFCILLY